jgi:N-acetylmuramoyl-L-alanine amidase
MKKLLLLAIAILTTLSGFAQMQYGLVKDEDGYTNIRKGPGTNYTIVGRLDDGSLVNFEKAVNGWCKVYTTYTDGEQEFLGYMAASKIVVPKRSGAWKYIGIVRDEDGYTNIRKGPGTNYAIVGKVKDGRCILYSGEYGDKWYKVYTQNGTFRGYMSANKILETESPAF